MPNNLARASREHSGKVDKSGGIQAVAVIDKGCADESEDIDIY